MPMPRTAKPAVTSAPLHADADRVRDRETAATGGAPTTRPGMTIVATGSETVRESTSAAGRGSGNTTRAVGCRSRPTDPPRHRAGHGTSSANVSSSANTAAIATVSLDRLVRVERSARASHELDRSRNAVPPHQIQVRDDETDERCRQQEHVRGVPAQQRQRAEIGAAAHERRRSVHRRSVRSARC